MNEDPKALPLLGQPSSFPPAVLAALERIAAALEGMQVSLRLR